MNNIRLAKRYSDMLDEIYMTSAKTAAIETDRNMVRETANVAEVMIPTLSMDGLADYSREDGYVKGDVSLTWETVRFDYERGRRFEVDVLDNAETAGVAFGSLAGEFIRTQAVPELDAVRFASLASKAGETAEATLSTGEQVIAALRNAVTYFDSNDVPEDQRILFIGSGLMGLIEDMDETRSRSVMGNFAKVIRVPQSRFTTDVTLLDGTSEGETSGGFICGGDNINFLLVHKPAVLVFTRNVLSKIIPPELNPASDGWIYAYRSYGMCQVYRNKNAGIYAHINA
ncbi:MAG: hypothetical protein II695_06100 [Oscillospiraceae bacterium]|nr:hypothetical protein [Oscillospiraceae bacterium]